jgi:hypothetical protein
MKFSLGSDPEFMLVSANNQYKSAIDVVPGTKKDPLPLGNGHTAFYDNVLAECCPNYGKSKEEVIFNFRDCFQRYANVVRPFRLVPQASHVYPKKECEHLEAMEFGCSPEMNAYEMVSILPPECKEGSTFRSGGGHIHLGHVQGDQFPLLDGMGKFWTARMLDFFVGIPSIFMDTDPTSQDRRKLYGGAGNMREKNYGIEYRTLSVFWLASPQIVRVIWDLCEFTINYMQKSDNFQKLWEDLYEKVRITINKGNVNNAKELFDIISKRSKMPKGLIASIYKVAELRKLNFYSEWKIE